MWHVTRSKDLVEKEGFREGVSEGFGNRLGHETRGISVTYSRETAESLAEQLDVAARAARGEATKEEVLDVLLRAADDDVGADELAEALGLPDIDSDDFEGLIQAFDGDAFDFHEQAADAVMGIEGDRWSDLLASTDDVIEGRGLGWRVMALTADRANYAAIKSDQVAVLQVASSGEPLLGDVFGQELRFAADDLETVTAAAGVARETGEIKATIGEPVPAGGVARETGGALPSVLSQTHITGKGVTAERLYERINMGNGVPSIDPPGTTYGDLQKQGRTHFAFDPEAEVISLEEVRQLPDKYPEYFKRIPREGTRLELIEPISPLKHAHPPDDTGLPGPVRLDESVPLTVHADAPVHVPSEKPWTTLPPPNLGDDVADELAEKVMTTRNGMTTKLADLMSSNLEDAQEAASSVLLRDIMDDPPTTEQVAAVQRYLRERTQEFLSPLPDEVTVYRFGNLDRPGVASLTAGGAPLSFTLNPRYNYREGLPWSEAREVAGERFVAYTVKKSDIELAMDMRAGKAIGEDELLIHPSNVRPVPAG